MWKLIFSKEVVSVAIKLSLVVGSILAFINHGPDIIDNNLSVQQQIQILITYMVPYAVSSYSSVKFIKQIERIN